MKLTQFSLALISVLSITSVHAANLETQRIDVAKAYINDLQNADYKAIVQLFMKDAYVVSTSSGKIDAKDFFYSFLPNITSAKTDLHQTFTDGDKVAARFNFIFKMKDGSEGAGEYIDEFVFAKNSTKLTMVYMFENLKFKP